MVSDNDHWPWAAEIADLDHDGYQDLLMGGKSGTGESYVYWGSIDGEYHDDNVTVLPPPTFFAEYRGASIMISTASHDINGDGLLDVLLGGHGTISPSAVDGRGAQILINRDNRRFTDETDRRLGDSAWSADEPWPVEYRFLDFNQDGTIDIVPQLYPASVPNVVAWLNDGTGHYVALKPMMFGDETALQQFAEGLKVREGSEFRALTFFGDGQVMAIDTGVVATDALITLAN